MWYTDILERSNEALGYITAERIKMNLKARRVHPCQKDYDKIKKLMKTAFPKNEQMPIWLLQLLALREGVNFLAFYDGGEFAGIAHTVSTDRMIFVTYLAVNDGLRSKGYGSQILQWLKSRSRGREITLNVEPLEKNAENLSQRVRRLNFYKRNGFHDTGWLAKEPSQYFAVLSTSGRLSLGEYKRVFGRLSFGLYIPSIIKGK